MDSWIEQHAANVRIRLRVQPRASRTEITGLHDGALRVRVAAPPVEGEANVEVVRFLAKRLRVAASRIVLTAGATGRTKTIEIEDAAVDDVARILLP